MCPGGVLSSLSIFAPRDSGDGFGVASRVHPPRLCFCMKLFASTQKCTELRFCMMQICGAAASELHSCKPRLDQNENGMLRTFIPAGSGLRSGGARDLCNRESQPAPAASCAEIVLFPQLQACVIAKSGIF